MKLSIPVLLIVIGIGSYIYVLNDQIADIDEVCSLFPEGAPLGDLKELERKYSVRFMGLSRVKDKPGAQRALFCATLTMCDTFCSVEFEHNEVVKAGVSNL